MKQYIDGKYVGTIVLTKQTLKQKIERKLRIERDKRLLKALTK
jgi:hypothetical protein